MPNWVKFNCFVEDIAEGVHNLGADTIMCALTNTAPDPSGDAVLTDITQISATGGYAPATVTPTSSTQVGGTYAFVSSAFSWTASGADFDAFRWLVLYNDTAAGKNLIAFVDYGVPYALPSGQPFTHQAGTLMTLA